eukprot:TRINITY_DN4496_c0_g1_i1.p1 TRINITY_DN4496_c0_g1~~TRINITY_DN4496_c0_g1_i1.p1  ORF type:complete len:164 (+),score=23.47 TRINITY_DN4496_c0_g1_i1:119-610(+)
MTTCCNASCAAPCFQLLGAAKTGSIAAVDCLPLKTKQLTVRISSRNCFASPSCSTASQRCAVRAGGRSRGRSVHYEEADTWVLIEADEDECFVTTSELKTRLKLRLLQSFGAENLPADLRAFPTIDEAVDHLLLSACEVDLGAGQGNMQWFEVRLKPSFHQQE